MAVKILLNKLTCKIKGKQNKQKKRIWPMNVSWKVKVTFVVFYVWTGKLTDPPT